MYIKNNDKIIPDGLTQCWKQDLSTNGATSVKKLIELKQNYVITDLDIEILKTLLHFDAMPIEYLSKLLGYEDTTPILERLSKLITFHAANCFMLTDGSETVIKDDAKIFYCLDTGGARLISAYTDDEEADNYRIETLITTSTKLNKRLMAIDFYLILKEAVGNRLKYYGSNPILSCGGSKYSPKAFFTIENEGKKKAYILEVVRFNDFYEADSVKFSGKLSRCDAIINTNAWKKYYDGDTAPALLMLVDNDDAALRCAELANTIGLIDEFRICTSDSLKKGLSNAFYKYKDDKLTPVRLKNFAKNKK